MTEMADCGDIRLALGVYVIGGWYYRRLEQQNPHDRDTSHVWDC